MHRSTLTPDSTMLSPNPRRASLIRVSEIPSPNLKPRRHKIFPPKSKVNATFSEGFGPQTILQDKVHSMEKRIDELTTSLFCKERRQKELESKIVNVLSAKSSHMANLQSKISRLFDTIHSKEHEILALQLQVKRATRCSAILKQNKTLEQILTGSQSSSFFNDKLISGVTTKHTFQQGTGLIRNFRYSRPEERMDLECVYVDIPRNKQILSPFSLQQNKLQRR